MKLSASIQWKLAASVGLLAIGIGPVGLVHADAGDVGVNAAAAVRAAEDAQRALARGRIDRAIASAEAAVAADPSNVEHRALLGRIYLTAGRYVSADQSLDAAIALGASDSRTIIGAAMALIANDRAPDALALVERHAERLPASDYGLALALAGSPERAVMVLSDVARAEDATARDRQNLALAYALAGRWLEARLIAAQDMGPEGSEGRMTEWARLAQAGPARGRIAALLGREAVEDAGMPQRLALDGHVRAPRLAASEDPAPLALYAPRPETAALSPNVREQLAEAPPAPPALPTVPAPAPAVAEEAVGLASAPAAPVAAPETQLAAVSTPTIRFVSIPVVQPLPTRTAQNAGSNSVLERIVATITRPFRSARPRRVAASVRIPAPTGAQAGRWGVQLAAFEQASTARREWSRLSNSNASLAQHRAVTTRATVGGRTFYRLSLSGFGSQGEAARACAALGRGQCFVRAMPAREAVLWASRAAPARVAAARGGMQVAAR